LEEAVGRRWSWKGRRGHVYDGSSVTMPDTPQNQAAHPQPAAQKPGLGFPLARIAAVFSLASGAIPDVGICRYAGKGRSELGMPRTLPGLFRPGDVVLADRLMCAGTEMVMLRQRGVDSVRRFTSHRKADFRRGKRLGRGDHVVVWPKPPRPRTIDRAAYARLPDALTVRECRVQVEQPGFRIRTLVLATTLLDADAFAKADLAQLYRARRHAELDLRSLKQTLQSDVLRCETPDLVRKELWAHVPAYNSDSHRHRPSREHARHRAAVDQLQGGRTDPRSVPAGDRPVGRTRRGIAQEALRATAQGHRQPAGRGPPRPLRAAPEEAPAQAARPPDEATARGQT